ncbi:hypothetical protein SASPL_109287 [Salvia splendens]|uniref:Uncharacterized protein n=1 Tax=Salvia splendens TaxID=180675 RepID=A0A8X8YJQ3_SALSN|nr:hypothetical protein SASPL_109287 [Salvia splendens]
MDRLRVQDLNIIVIAMPMSELAEFLKSGNIKLTDFDALIYGLKKTIWKLMNTTEGFKSSQPSGVVEHDLKSSNSHCLSYVIKDLSQKSRRFEAKASDEGSALQLDVLQKFHKNASRSSACIRITGSQEMCVVLGETRDTDHEEMISGTHKTLIMKDVVGKGSEELPGSYLRDDIVPEDNPLIAYIKGAAAAREIFDTLRQLFKTAV